MKFVTYEGASALPVPGVLIAGDRHILPLGAMGDDSGFESVQAVIEAGGAALARIREFVGRAEESAGIPADSVRLLAPLPRPVQIRDVLCFLDHMRNAARAMGELMGASAEDIRPMHPRFAEVPVYYKANRMCVVGPEQEIERPPGCKMLDYELEFGMVVGTQGKNIPREKARDHIFGYTIFNDVSARDLQGQEMPAGLGPAKGKDFDTGNVLGPCIVTADEVDPDDLTMIARVNGEEVSRGSSSQMDHKVEDVVSYISRGETIYPGEIFGSGTVPLGCGLEHMRFLQDGDVIELEITGIGVLRNRVVALKATR